MRTFLKAVLILCLLMTLILVPPVVAMLLGYSVWSGAMVSAGALGLLLFFFLMRFLWSRYRERKFVNGLVSKGASAEDKAIASEQRKQWKMSVAELKKSHLRVKGDPLYVLPWYMVMGESGTGKSTAIENSGLVTNLAQPPRVSGVSGTRNCEWWFFNEAIVLDTAGRYATHQDESQDKREWHSFLKQLARYRKKEPLNGLVVTVSAKTLLTGTRDEIEEEGRKIRDRINELMKVIGARFPIYLLVTKCDLIQGMTEFCEQLPDAVYEQVFGSINGDMQCDASFYLSSSFAQVTKKLRNYRLQVARSLGAESAQARVLFFPEEFQGIESRLKTFADAAFSSNVYQEPPFLRGLFFSSARQSGHPFSKFPEAARLLKGKGGDGEQDAADTSYFLHDLFSKILPTDRNIHVPTRRLIEGKRRLKVMAFSSLALASLTLGVLLSYSFSQNLSMVREVQREYAMVPSLRGELAEDVDTLERLRLLIRNVEEKNESRLLPDFGLDHCSALERDLKVRYCDRFQGVFLAFYDTKMGDAVVNFSGETSEGELAGVFPHYIRRINLIAARNQGADPEALNALPQPDFKSLLIPDGHWDNPSVLESVSAQYLDYLAWASPKMLAGEKAMLASWLSYGMKNEELSLSWVVTWCNGLGGIPSLTLAEFWEGSHHLSDEPFVGPAFTLKGREQVFGMLTELEQALESPLEIAQKKSTFLAWYHEAYAQSWHRFATYFPKGQETVTGKEESISTLVRMGTQDNPYFALLSEMALELSFFPSEVEESPLWMEPIFEFEAIRQHALLSTQKKKGVPNVRVPGKGAKFLYRIKKVAGPVGKEDQVPEAVAAGADAFNRYAEGLSGMSTAALSPAGAFALAGTAFTEDPVSGGSAVRTAMHGEESLKIVMETHRTPRALFRTLLRGPFDYLWADTCNTAGRYLQDVWDETVLSEIQGVYNKKSISGLLFGKGGAVKRFVAGPAKPFIGKKSKKGYYAKEVAGRSIPFTDSLFTYVTRGTYSVKSEKAVFKVTIEGLPTDINPEATIQPHITTLELESVDKTQVLTNRNYRAQEVFDWSPKEGGAVTLTIGVGDLVLEKKYIGGWAFAKFIKDFSNGRHEFRIRDFPEERASLKRKGVRYIRVKYKMTGTKPILRMMNNVAGKPPEVIVAWLD
ncbi:type VI secretion protein IcmF/TssM N-terminal domain-containing protein [Desulfoluna butyratoxydans]|uniref:p-loop containing nucleoside triphosphate hydrolase n=1 Tax=Desulfoluna butyratoxydans TaxID=231438 RepID=A0A4U8YSR4_9BACT|nr:type VI secretion protein IcmF/TssM N-terminal domain-containing protein [Desulfoluna butyratoxydans]VFQ44892.1 p-loop containing nucleoside triphosphate hydrolase [Desulfoluna butyratoxydans]